MACGVGNLFPKPYFFPHYPAAAAKKETRVGSSLVDRVPSQTTSRIGL